jgi:hypothetical protein
MAAEGRALAVSRRQVMQGAGAVGLGLLAGCGRWPGQAQPRPKVHRIGWLGFNPPSAWPEAFQQGLQALGYVEGQNVVIKTRYADSNGEQFPALAAELAALP